MELDSFKHIQGSKQNLFLFSKIFIIYNVLLIYFKISKFYEFFDSYKIFLIKNIIINLNNF